MEKDFDYYALRERRERAAAKSASSVAARHAHQELAERYWSLARSLNRDTGA